MSAIFLRYMFEKLLRHVLIAIRDHLLTPDGIAAKNELDYITSIISSFLQPGQRDNHHAVVANALNFSLADNFICLFAYGGSNFLLHVGSCGSCYRKELPPRSLGICGHGSFVKLRPVSEHVRLEPGVLKDSFIAQAVSLLFEGFDVSYYNTLERASASHDWTSLFPIMFEYGYLINDLRKEKEEIEAKAFELAKIRCNEVNAQIEKICGKFKDSCSDFARVVPMEQDEHTVGCVQRTVDVGTVHAETHLGE